MAVTKITWENKTGIQNDTSVARKNKVTDEDMNEIKQVVNNNADELGTVKDNVEDLQGGQGTANADITSLKNRVSTLETDNTQNKSDINTLKSDNQTNKSNISTMQSQISDMQQEQQTQNTNIENNTNKNIEQDKLLTKYKNALLNAETEEAKSLYVEDANKFGNLEVLGNQEQDNTLYKGKLEQGTITDGENVDNIVTRVRTAEYIEVKENTKIKVSATGAEQYYVYYYDTSKIYITAYGWVNINEETTIPQNTKYIRIVLRKTDNSNITIEGITDFVVGPTPSPDYPSPVVCLGSNKQLFDKDNANKVYGQSNFEVTDNGLKIINTGSLQYMTCVFKLFDVSNCKGKNFTVKTKFTASKNNTARVILGLCNEDGTERQSGSKFINISGDYITYNVPSDLGNTKYLALWLYSNFDGTANPGDYVLYEELKIEEGDTATSYSPYRTR